jgi:NAD-dependent dihydropyrimidine dehydrogenase PreA subunit
MMDLIKTIIETMFRFFPFPTGTGLRVVGQPGPDAPVFVTCNFDLTVRRVLSALDGLDCYLLVAPSKGINVWCAAGGIILNAHSVTSVVKTSRIADKVDHRTLVLPQLSAPGIDVARVEQETGWRCTFGPVYAHDIPAYLAAERVKTDDMRRVEFPLRDRLEMAVMWAAPMSIVAGIPVAIFSLESLLGVQALIWAFTLFAFIFFEQVLRYVPGPVGQIKMLVLSIVGITIVVAYGLLFGDWGWGTIAGWSLGILAVGLVLGFDLDGTSPLNAASTVTYWGRKWPWIHGIWAKFGYEMEHYFTLQVDPGLCTGCSTCIEVCPKCVFESYQLDGVRTSRVARMLDCAQCTACVKQCPETAIMADPPIRSFAQ